MPPLPEFGKKEEGGQQFHQGIPPYGRVIDSSKKRAPAHESLDDYFCRGMDTSGPASWDRVLREMERGSLEDVGSMNYKMGVREEVGHVGLKNHFSFRRRRLSL